MATLARRLEAAPLIVVAGGHATLALDDPEAFREFVEGLRSSGATAPTDAELSACTEHLRAWALPEHFPPPWLLLLKNGSFHHFSGGAVLTALASVLKAESLHPNDAQPAHSHFGCGRVLTIKVVEDDAVCEVDKVRH